MQQQRNTQYKTQLCDSYRKTGFCRFGKLCLFAHGEKELICRPVSDKYKTQLCTRWMESNGRYCSFGSACIFAHGPEELRHVAMSDGIPPVPKRRPGQFQIRRTKPQNPWGQRQMIPDESPSPPRFQRPDARPTSFAKQRLDVDQGVDDDYPAFVEPVYKEEENEPYYKCVPIIRKGPNGFNPRFYKTAMCETWEAGLGACPYGENCWFAHGRHELREPEPAYSDNVSSVPTSQFSVNTSNPYFQKKREHPRLRVADIRRISHRDVQRARKRGHKYGFIPTHNGRQMVEVPHECDDPRVYAIRYVFLEDQKTVLNPYPRISEDPTAAPVSLGEYMVCRREAPKPKKSKCQVL